VDCLGIFDDMVGALDFDEKAVQRVITNLAQNLLSVCSLSLRFTCKMRSFRSGAEGNRTPDLRRVKAALCETSALIEVPGYVDRRKLAHP
jgi:hypothetical protein